MPRPRRAPAGPNSIIASAARIQGRRARGNTTTAGPAGDWQDEAVFMVTAVGELGFYRDWKANAFSRVTIDLELVTIEDGEEKTTKVTRGNVAALGPLAELALNARDALFDGDDGESELMRSFGQHLSIPGEAWLFGIVNPDLTDPDAPDQWRVLARTECKLAGGSWEVNRGDGVTERYSLGNADGEGAEAIAIRIWNPNPDQWAQADSSVRNALPILRQIKGLHELDGASIDSRLKGAGVMFMPSEATFSAPLEETADPADVRQDEFMASLTEVMMLARSDRSSAAAHVPVVVKVPGAMIEKIKHVTFDTPFDERSDAKLERAIKRLATTLDCPAEIVLGLADVNHWTGWLLDEQALKYHVQSPAGLVMDGLTKRYLWSVLSPTGVLSPEVRAFRFKANVSKLQQKPDRAVNAPAAHAELLITDKAYASVIGFDPADLLDPTSDEFKRRLLIGAAMRPGGPDTVTQALTALGVQGISPPAAMVAPGQLPPPAITGPDQGTPAPGAGDGPPTQPVAPPAPPSVAASGEQEELRGIALTLGCEAYVARAIEKARNRVHQRSRTARPVPADRMDWALEGAWEQVPRIAATLAVDEATLRDALNLYTRKVLATGTEHSPDVFARVIRERVLQHA